MRFLVLTSSLLASLALLSPIDAAETPFTDAVAYCQAVGNADAPDALYTGLKVPDWMIPALYTNDEIKAQKKSKVDPARAVVWRCMGGKVWGCVQGNAPICGKANQEMSRPRRCANSAPASPTRRSFRSS